jgi:hypothetical protein
LQKYLKKVILQSISPKKFTRRARKGQKSGLNGDEKPLHFNDCETSEVTHSCMVLGRKRGGEGRKKRLENADFVLPFYFLAFPRAYRAPFLLPPKWSQKC